MERLQGHINNSCLLGDHLDVEGFEQGFVNQSLRLGKEEEYQYSTASLEDTMPFLQMLPSVETPPFFHFKEPYFQTLLKLQHLKKPWDTNFYMPETETQVQALELESRVTRNIVDLYSPAKSETKGLQNTHSNHYSCLESADYEPKTKPQHSIEIELPCCREGNSDSSIPRAHAQTMLNNYETHHFSKTPTTVARERRKRKRTRPSKNKEEAESQRMTHIAVERNRRRQMNDYLNSLRSLMPPSYVQRGDQASIIGGAIDFVKELEQLLQCLEVKKKIRKGEDAAGISSDGLFPPPPPLCDVQMDDGGDCDKENADGHQKMAAAAEIEVTSIHNLVNLKVRCERRPGQLLRAILALEDLRLTVLHLNITSSHATVLYAFNLKVEDDCKVGSVDEVAAAVRQIFNIVSGIKGHNTRQ